MEAIGGGKRHGEFFELLRVVELRDAETIGANCNDFWLHCHSVTYRSNKVAAFVINDEVCRL